MATKPRGARPCILHLFRHQKAQGLLGVAPGKAVDAQVFAPVVGEAFQQQPVGVGQARDLALQGQPPGGVGGQVGPAVLLEDRQDAVGQQGGGGELGAVEHRDLGVAAGVAGDLDRHLAQAFVADDLAADQEGVAGGEGGGEVFLDLAQGGAADPAFQAHLQGFDVDDRAKVLADQRGGAGVAQVPFAAGLLQPLPAVIGLQRVAAGGDEIETGVELGSGQVRHRGRR